MAIQIAGAIFGAKELSDALSLLPKALGKSAIRSAMKKAVKPVVKTAKEKAPKRTGAGAKSIKARNNKDLKPIGISIGPDRKHFYMMYSEWGTSKQVATPFLRPAWDMHKQAVLDSLGDELWAAIQKRARTIARKAESGTLGKRTTKFIRGF